jgi:ABC-type Fe3+-hydroxamate transport system substrate-binding protein
MADTKPAETETVTTEPRRGRPATQVTAALTSVEKVDEFKLTRKALGLETDGDAVRQAIDEFIEAHAERTAKYVEFFAS